jgi:hypothetical protein
MTRGEHVPRFHMSDEAARSRPEQRPGRARQHEVRTGQAEQRRGQETEQAYHVGAEWIRRRRGYLGARRVLVVFRQPDTGRTAEQDGRNSESTE